MYILFVYIYKYSYYSNNKYTVDTNIYIIYYSKTGILLHRTGLRHEEYAHAQSVEFIWKSLFTYRDETKQYHKMAGSFRVGSDRFVSKRAQRETAHRHLYGSIPRAGAPTRRCNIVKPGYQPAVLLLMCET